MADAPQAPTEEQLQQVKTAQDMENARWADDFNEEDLNIPYKREDGDVSNESANDTSDKDEPGDSSEDESGDDSNASDVDYTEIEPVITTQDPGEYQPADYSFEVTLKDGKTVKISTPDEADKLADDPDNFETPKQLMDFINKQNKMNQKLDKDYEKWENQKKTHDDQTEVEQQRQNTINTFIGEFGYLEDKGLLPKVDSKYADADWTNPDIAKQPGVKERNELLDYFRKENTSRTKSGVKPLTSMIDTFNAWQIDTNRQQAEVERKQAGEQRKVAGARVAGVSPAQQGAYVPKGIAVGRVIPSRSAAVWDD